MKVLHRIWRCRSGVTAVEYGVWAGVFVIMIFAAFGAMADMLEVAFNKAETAIAATIPEDGE